MFINFGLVGCGRISHRHCEVLTSGDVRGARLHGVCDIKKDRSSDLASKFNIKQYDDMHALAADPAINVIVVLTESGTHSNVVIELAKYGKSIIVEKPMALTITDANRMIKECSKYNAKLFVVKQNRYNKPVQFLKKLLSQNELGKINIASVRVRWCRDQAYYNQDSWRGTWKYDGGVLTNQASHHLDLMIMAMGDVQSVFAYSKRELAKIEAEDTAVVILKFKSGAFGLFEATTAARPTDIEGSMSILGDRGNIEIGGFAVNKLVSVTLQDANPLNYDEYTENPKNVYGYGHTEYYKNVVNGLNGGPTNIVDGEEGIRSLRVLHAIYKSIETNMEITVDDECESSKLGL